MHKKMIPNPDIDSFFFKHVQRFTPTQSAYVKLSSQQGLNGC